MPVTNYKGTVDDKAATLSRYRYAMCFENSFHPLWTEGYLTEKILDCMACGTIPVYYGCSNIDALVPDDCFLDWRHFESPHELDMCLQNMTDHEYLGYCERMLAFMNAYNPAYKHSAYRLYETIAALNNTQPSAGEKHMPNDYLDSCTRFGKFLFYTTAAIYPVYQNIYPAFACVRKLNRIFSK